MPDCLLHIGVEKTGSTSIQMTLARNRAALAGRGVLYPLAFGDRNHVKAYAYASESGVDELKAPLGLHTPAAVKSFREAVRTQLAAEIASAKPKVVVVSNEHCSSRLMKASEIERLAALLRRHCDGVKVVAYIRRQGEALRSAYSTYIKTGGTEDFGSPGADEVARKYDYEAILGRWAAVFGAGNIEVRLYEREAVASVDVVEDFLVRLGVAPGDFTIAQEMNKSLGRAGLEFLRRFNRLVPYTVGPEFNPMRGNIQVLLEGLPDDAPFLGDPAIIARLDGAMASANERVRARYLRQRPWPLFAAPAAAEEAAPPVRDSDVMRVMAFIWEAKQVQVMKLKERLDSLGNGSGGRQAAELAGARGTKSPARLSSGAAPGARPGAGQGSRPRQPVSQPRPAIGAPGGPRKRP